MYAHCFLPWAYSGRWKQINHRIIVMNKLQAYFRDSYQELVEKVSWPTWAQLQQSTSIVLAATLVITAIVWLMDLGSSNILKFVYSLFK